MSGTLVCVALLIAPTTTSGSAPPPMAAWKTANFPVNPLVSGMPAKAIRKKANVPATSGDRLPSPAQRDRCSASPAWSRTSVTTANAPMTATP